MLRLPKLLGGPDEPGNRAPAPFPLGASALPAAIGLLLLADLASCWAIAYRLLFRPGGSFYAFGFIGDEYTYAERIQQTLAGASAGNPLNGSADPRYVSILYLEDLLRLVVTTLHLNIALFVWAWRVLFPVSLMGSLALLARACVPRMGRPWERWLILAVCGAGFPLLFLVYEEVTDFPPLGGWIHRFPTGIEYVLAALLAWAFLRFLRTRSAARGVVLALVGSAMVYLRPYAAIAWAPAIAIPFVVLLAARAIPMRSAAAAGGAAALALAPWWRIKRWDESLPVYQALFRRYLSQPEPGVAHAKWPLFAGFAVFLLFAAWRARAWWRPFALGAAAALILLPFNVHWLPMAAELLHWDRFGVLYLVASLTALFLWIGQHTPAWNDRAARRGMLALVACGALASALLWRLNTQFDLAQYPLGPLRHVQPDVSRVPAYLWIQRNTRPDALFLAELPRADDWDHVDLFGTVARRRRVFAKGLNGYGISQEMYASAQRLYSATMDVPASSAGGYLRDFGQWRPEYILWKKGDALPHPHASWALLLPYRTVVYSDAFSEIWRIDIDGLMRRQG